MFVRTLERLMLIMSLSSCLHFWAGEALPFFSIDITWKLTPNVRHLKTSRVILSWTQNPAGRKKSADWQKNQIQTYYSNCIKWLYSTLPIRNSNKISKGLRAIFLRLQFQKRILGCRCLTHHIRATLTSRPSRVWPVPNAWRYRLESPQLRL